MSSSTTLYIAPGATNQTVIIPLVQDAAATSPGEAITGLAYNTASLTAYYKRGATGAATALTLATQTATGAHSDGGFVAVDGTNMLGVYRLDLSDAIVASGVPFVTLTIQGAADLAPHTISLQLLDNAASVTDAVLDEALSGHTTAGTVGKAISDILTDTGTDIPATLATIAGYIDTEIAAILTDTGTTLDGKIDAIKVITDQMVFTKANELDVNLLSINDVTITGDGGSGTEFDI